MKLTHFLSTALLSSHGLASFLEHILDIGSDVESVAESILDSVDFYVFEESEIEATTIVKTSKGDFTIESRLTGFKGCPGDNQTKIQEAFVDALKIVNSVGNPTEIIGRKPGSDYEQGQEAYDYWGPQKQWSDGLFTVSGNYKRAILGGTETWRGDWWWDRYFQITCDDPLDRCSSKEGLHAYENDPNTKEHSGKYPRINFCPRFFEFQPSLKERIGNITNGVLPKDNPENLRSRGSIMLHEMFHTVANSVEVSWNAGISQPKAVDHKPYEDQDSSRGSEKAYGAHRAKYLAKMKNRAMSRLVFTNTDNYVYYALSTYMMKHFKTAYPEEPPASWSAPAIQGEDEELSTDDDPNTAVSDFSTDEPLLSDEELYQQSSEDDEDITCSTSDSSPALETCLEIIRSQWTYTELRLNAGRPGKSWWFAYQTGCAISLNYISDWSVNGTDEAAAEEAICGLTYYDALVSTLSIVTKCATDGKIGGKIPFGRDDCKAEIEIIVPHGLPPTGI
ncbi:unnamed protein product [Periconia digitata]|uniref:Lysine-specific metallo-endopeptidase domain-containing protein n=1 Tax=Periconia digitata TaxID=1303443 RepID=A0A9W4UGF7_9PLEO|nr:unnamed protein product [Periconia digitata]